MKKLLNKRGSVLFLVVVVMSLLIIAASATYYVVSNQHSSVEVRYGSEQSYQTALSVSDAVSDYISGYANAILASGSDLDEISDNIITKMLALGTNDTITADDIDLTSLGIGSANVTISRYSSTDDADGNTVQQFAIATTAEVNGESTTITKIISFTTGPAEYFTRFLTCTGYRSEDVVFGAYEILNESYFENEYTVFGSESSAATKLSDNIYSSYTVALKTVRATEEIEVVTAEDLILLGDDGTVFLPEGGKAYVGCDFSNLSTKGIGGNGEREIYVLGNLNLTGSETAGYMGNIYGNTTFYVNGDCTTLGSDSSDVKFYINGDLYINGQGNILGEYYVTGNVYLNLTGSWGYGWLGGKIEYGKEIYADGVLWTTNGAWTGVDNASKVEAGDRFTDDKVTEAKEYIATSTAQENYQDWNVETYFDTVLNKNGNIPTVQPSSTGDGYTEVTTEVIGTNNVSMRVCTIDDHCILKPSVDWINSNNSNCRNYIVIDATEKDIYIKLEPLDGSTDFAFIDLDADGYGYSPVNVIVEGTHSVIFILPEDVQFKNNSSMFVGHLDVALAMVKYKNGTDYSTLDDLIKNVYMIQNSFAGLSDDQLDEICDSFYYNSSDALVFDTTSSGSIFLGYSDIHNNIFLVTTGKDNLFEFEGGYIFCGYIYAPYAKLINGITNGVRLTFIGGMIIGTYNYVDMQAALVFTRPYDYNNNYGLSTPTDIVKYLISFSNSNGGGSSSGESSTLQGYSTLGYK